MSLVANKMVADLLSEQLKDVLTVYNLQVVLDSLTKVLSKFEIEPAIIEDCSNDVMLDAFLEALRVEGRSERTLKHYRYVITKFLQHSKVQSINVTQYHIRTFLSNEKNRGIADGTIKGYCWVFSSYFGWLHRDGIIQRNPMGNIGTIKTQKKVKEVFTEVDIEKMKNGCKTLRDKALIYFMKSTCCRVGEIERLNRDDIDFTNLECIVLGKGNKQRHVYFDAVTGMMLQEYLKSRKDDNPALFVGETRHDRLKQGGIRAMLSNLSKRTGVSHIHPHKFRRTEITELVAKGMPIELVKEIAGHEKIDTTMGYVKIDQLNVKNSYRKYA